MIPRRNSGIDGLHGVFPPTPRLPAEHFIPPEFSPGFPQSNKRKPLPLIALFILVINLFLLACLTAPAGKTPAASTPIRPTATTGGIPTGSPVAPWSALRGGSKLDQGWGVDTDSAGNIYFATFQQAEKEPFADMVVYKFAPDGTERWRTRWGGKYMEKAFIVTVAGSFAYVGGLTYTSAFDLTAADMAVLALDTNDGSVVWEFTWGQGFGYEEVDGLVADGDSLYLSGWTTGKTTGNDVAVLKLDLHGNLIWAKSWGSPGWDEGDGQMVVDEDTLYVAGRYNGINAILGGEGFLARFSKETGEYLSHTAWGGPLGTDALGMTGDGTCLYTVGLTVDRGNGGQIFLRKWDKDLNLIWEQLWGGKGSEDARAAAIGPAGDIYVAGATDSYGSGGGMDIVLLRFDPDGKLVWARTLGGPQNDAAHGIALFADRVYIAGNTRSAGSGQDDALLIFADAGEGLFPLFP
ncbi:MAG: PQQ-binding-like beta-propeller repeat protein [Anaerolineales bacterium]